MTDAEIAKEKAELNAWVAKQRGWVLQPMNPDYNDHPIDKTHWMAQWLDEDGKTVFLFHDFRPTEILEQAMEVARVLGYFILFEPVKDNGWSLTVYGFGILEESRCKTLPDCAYQIVKTIKEQSEVNGG